MKADTLKMMLLGKKKIRSAKAVPQTAGNVLSVAENPSAVSRLNEK